MKVEDINAVITGGASGLGKATAEIIIKNSGKVTIFDTQEEKGTQFVKDMNGECDYLFTDVTDENSIIKNLDIVKNKLGDINLVVNCAGIGTPEKILGKEGIHSTSTFEKVISVNLTGTFNIIKCAADKMKNNSPNQDNFKGLIINTASIAAYDGQIGQAAYSASKGGIVAMTLPIARELAKFGIRVCTIAPGIFDTPLMQLAPDKVRDPLLESTQFPHRFGQPSEFGQLAAHIVENSYLNGETIRLDSGMRMKPR